MACALGLGCGDGKGKEKGAAQEAASQEDAAKPEVWEGEYECKRGDAKCRDDNSLGEGVFFGGTVYNTVISADANVRDRPSTKGSNVLFQLTKGTKVQVLGATKDGWMYIVVRDFVPRRGWLFKNIEYKEEKITPVDLKVTGFKAEPGNFEDGELTASYTAADGAEKTVTFRGYKEKEQNFYTFFYDIFVDGSRYDNLPGLYTWQHTNNRLTHRRALVREPYNVQGASKLWEKAMFTNDFKYYLVYEDGGNNILIFSADGDRRILAESGVSEPNLRNKTVKTDCPADDLIKKDFPHAGDMDEEISEYRNSYLENNPEPDGGGFALKVLCTVNFETGARKIAGAGWTEL
jgi:hypothetical protein